ncbi:MAG: hypothetical protein A2X93_07930 [Deltaproteobacteria bacterium GWC2_56_8]|nr:MAG: hypothetical protein A2X93_07930 [Deltaproteobacteria bacterium GWC2_56_8]
MYPKIIEKREIPVNDIVIEQGIYPREGNNDERIKMFREHAEGGLSIDPIRVSLPHDGKYTLIDGNHRYRGVQDLKPTIECEVLEVDPKNIKDLIKWAGIYNFQHGLPLTLSERKAFVCKIVQTGVSADELVQLISIPRTTVFRWTEHLKKEEKDKKSETVKTLKSEGLSVVQIAQKTGLNERTVHRFLSEKKSPPKKDAGTIRYEETMDMLKAGDRAVKCMDDNRAIAQARTEEAKSLAHTISDGIVGIADILLSSPPEHAVKTEDRIEILDSLFGDEADFRFVFRRLAIRNGNPIQMLDDIIAYLPMIVEFVEFAADQTERDMDTLAEIGSRTKTIQTKIKKILKLCGAEANAEASVDEPVAQEIAANAINTRENNPDFPDTRVALMMDWYFEQWENSPPEVENGKKGSGGRVARAIKELLGACDREGLGEPVEFLQNAYNFYREVEVERISSQDRFHFKVARDMTTFQNGFATILEYMKKLGGNRNGKNSGAGHHGVPSNLLARNKRTAEA